MGRPSPRIIIPHIPEGAIDPAGLATKAKLRKALYLPPYTVVAEALGVPLTTTKGWLMGKCPMPVEFFYAMVRILDIAPARAVLMAEELYHRRTRQLAGKDQHET